MKQHLVTLCILSLSSIASASPVQSPPTDDTVEHFEHRWKSETEHRTTTTHGRERAVVERSWSERYEETWSHSYYLEEVWTTDEGSRSDAFGGQTQTVRKRPGKPQAPVRQRSLTIGSQSPCSSSRTRCCPA